MCRIASLFFLERLKGSMSGDAHNFNNTETGAVIKFFFLQGKMPKDRNIKGTCTIVCHRQNWVAQFLNMVIFPPVMRLFLDDPKQ
jgi:hypothetical protein